MRFRPNAAESMAGDTTREREKKKQVERGGERERERERVSDRQKRRLWRMGAEMKTITPDATNELGHV